ncbi:fasciclin domain-containing protein [Dysgonomonas sp. BGC7]|uniref:fasciclin domain-containing protein n=1 Tax=Dysgonomonas sp. BGC7 TaxID=1658008 RepID=UPI0009E1E618|nr:fasciclin domain-containing protein [Dysgonomonas sp. BGC7]MBD8389000.1 fasciclin domain-containing protein [Dysgonomonas sp. BGC7]
MKKKNLNLNWQLLALLSFALCFTACSDDDNGGDTLDPTEIEKQKQSVVDELQKDNSLSVFTQVLNSIDVSGIDANQLTVFAFNNEAASGTKSTEPTISQNLVKRHIIKGAYTIEKLRSVDKIVSINKDTLFVSVDDNNNIMVNNIILKAPVTKPAGNSVIYVIDDIISMTSSGDLLLNESYTTDRCKLLTIIPEIKGFEKGTFEWKLVKTPEGASDSVLSKVKDLSFITVEEGEYVISLTAKDGALKASASTKIRVTKEKTAYSAYISNVFDYLPGVGQFVNDLPEYETGDTKETMRKKAENSLKGGNSSMIHLGGFGGYVTFGFDHTVVNIPGKRDFRVKGNAFWAASNPNPEAPKRGGSCEPGIIMVAYDKNGNGKPDEDEWYEIAGSEYYKPTTIKNYEITYYKPTTEPTGATAEYIKWEDNQGKSGYKAKNAFHSQPYFPEWITDNKITFKGTLLPNNAVDESGQGSYWVLYAYDWGYADNAPNTDDESAIDINWAVDAQGNKVHLPGIDFVKVYTGVNQEAGWLGEVSTEVAGAEDLHLLGKSINTRN